MVGGFLAAGILLLVIIGVVAKVLIDRRTHGADLAAASATNVADDPKQEAVATSPQSSADQPLPAQATAPSGSADDFGPREPNLKWKLESAPVKDGRAGVTIKLSVDRPMGLPAFWAGCDEPCETDTASIEGTYRQQPISANNPVVAVLSFTAPRPLPPGVQVNWVIRGKNATAVRIVTVQMMNPSTLPVGW